MPFQALTWVLVMVAVTTVAVETVVVEMVAVPMVTGASELWGVEQQQQFYEEVVKLRGWGYSE